MESYRELELWQKAIGLVTEIYRTTQGFPQEEIYALTSQMRRAAISIPANIAEGWGRRATKEYIQFLHIARGSLLELETHLTIARNLKYITSQRLETLLQRTLELHKMLNALISSLRKRTCPPLLPIPYPPSPTPHPPTPIPSLPLCASVVRLALCAFCVFA